MSQSTSHEEAILEVVRLLPDWIIAGELLRQAADLIQIEPQIGTGAK